MILCAFVEATYRLLSGKALVAGKSWLGGLHLVPWRDEALARWAAELEQGRWQPCPAHRQCSVRCWMIYTGYFAIQADENAPEVRWALVGRIA